MSAAFGVPGTRAATRSRTRACTQDDDGSYEIHKLLEQGEDDDGNRMYLVRWKDCASSEDTWELEATLMESAQDTVQAFKVRREQGDDGDDDEYDVEDDGSPNVRSRRKGRKVRRKDPASKACAWGMHT